MTLKIALCAMLAAAFLAFPPASPAGEAGDLPILAAQAKDPVPMDPGDECPSILFSKGVVEGTYDGVNCGYGCWLKVTLPGGEVETFLVGAEIPYYKGQVGDKVRVDVERRQLVLGGEGGKDYCRNVWEAVRAVVIP